MPLLRTGSTRHQQPDLFTGSSLLSPRLLRLSLFYVGLLFELVLCALFFNLNPSEPEEEEPPLFWEGFIADFWVAVFSTLLAIPPLLLISTCFCTPSGLKQKVKEATSLKQLSKVVDRAKKGKRKRVCCGMVLFALLSCFLCLYLIAFAHVASPSMSRDWLVSSFISLAIDLVVFEAIPAFSVTIFGLLYFGCKSKCFMCLLVLIESYRFVRNFVDL